jgi:hypothetical protein
MVSTTSVDARIVGIRLAKLLEHNHAVIEIRTLAQLGKVLLWVITVPTDLDAERRVVRAWMPLYDEFPNHDIDLRLLNPSHFPADVDVRDALPADAKLVSRA